MRLLTLLDSEARVLQPGTNGVYAGSASHARPQSTFLFANITRPGKLPIVDDRVSLRDLGTNRLAAMTVHQLPDLVPGVLPSPPSVLQFQLSSQQTDYRAVGFDTLLRVRQVAQRADGMLSWVFAPTDEGRGVEVTVLDHSVGSRLKAQGGSSVTISSGALMASAGAGEVVSFHAVEPSDVRDLRSGQDVWLSLNGAPVVLDSARRLQLSEFREGPLTSAFRGGQLFRMETLERNGILEPGDRFRLRALNVGSGTPTVVVRDGRLVVQDGVSAGDEAAIFLYAQLDDLDLFWNATTQDNATLTSGPPAPGYTRVRTEGRVFVRPRAGTIPLKQFFSSERGDTMSTATIEGQEAALGAGYVYRGIVGWVYERSRPETRVARQYWHAGRGDNMLTATRAGEYSCSQYEFAYDDCHVVRIDEAAAAPAPQPRVNQLEPIRGNPEDLVHDPHNVRAAVRDVELSPAVFSGASKPVRALVLSGGGAKGAFQAGALQALWRNGYRPDIVCGVSVGAINAAKVAEGRAESADELVELWRQFSSEPRAVYLKELYLNLLGQAAQDVAGAASDIGFWSIAAHLFTPTPPLPFVKEAPALGTALLVAETSGLSEQLRRLLNLAFMTHAIHSMEPLRRRLQENLKPQLIAAAGTRLRLGITDMKTGCYFSVTEPFSSSAALADHGLVELEPDMAEGGNWLTEPVYGADHYAMRLTDAVYASCTMPVFMEPLVASIRRRELIADALGRVAKLSLGLPPSVRELLDAAAPGGALGSGSAPIDFAAVTRVIDAYARAQGLSADDGVRAEQLRRRARLAADGDRGSGSAQRTLFDGGLVDAIPIRTALRMGATEILVIGVDQLNAGGAHLTSPAPITQYSWMKDLLGGDPFGGLDPASLPALQYVFGTLAGFVHGTTRGDLLSALGVVDARRVGELATTHMTSTERDRFATALRDQLRPQSGRRRTLLGGASSLGGWGHDDYGKPTRGKILIDVILPDRPLLDSLGFADAAGVSEALELGRMAARTPVSI